MEAVGQLAGGLAHDFNNLLTVILGNTELLSKVPDPTPERRELTRQIADAARKASSLTRQLLAFSRRQVLQTKRLDLNEVLADLYKKLYRVLGERVALQCNYAPELPTIDADPGMLEQVVMNLAVNAREAMPKGGRLSITTQTELLGKVATAANAEAREGRFVVLNVTDTGCGMDEATLNRVFEPFFTTKDVGKGTGLGLATVYGIVKQHNGWVEVASQVDQGTTFRIFLPAAAPATVKRESAKTLVISKR
jgi:signal transduction histidine kinase